MRRFILITSALWLPCHAQDTPPTPTEELRVSVREWVETMQKIQAEENAWEKDDEVLRGYKEGLEKEIEDLKEQIERARIRKEGGDKQSLDKVAERDRYIEAQQELSGQVQQMEQGVSAQIRLYPEGLRKQPKVALGIESVNASILLPVEKRSEEISKRLFAITELLSEVEKFQQGVHVHPELHKNSQGQEFRMDVVYFGLAAAYAVNEDGSFAEIGRPEADGWKFEERSDLAPSIKALIASSLSEKDVTFTQLPFLQP
jgi:hypothetical protein